MNQPTPLFKRVESQVNLPQLEEGILKLWTGLDAFKQSNARRKGANGKGEFVFYDGPPFATGTPHYGHLLAGTIKDIVPRFWNMRGFHVDRRFGWDCHGLPIENLAQKALGLNGTPEIRALGIDKFNEQCRSMVQTYVAEWRRTVTRMGRWVDFDNDYKTMDRDFMESVWWVFKRLWEQGRIYKAHRIMPYSWKLTTPLSNFEAGNNYKDVQDPAITVRFAALDEHGSPLYSILTSLPDSGVGTEDESTTSNGKKVSQRIRTEDRPTFFLAWTTTPWTLPSNLALCVGQQIVYTLIHDIHDNVNYILAKDRIDSYYKKKDDYRILTKLTGGDLADKHTGDNSALTYSPLFPCFENHSKSFRILLGTFVTTSDGTGIVHMAPAYGEDDYLTCRIDGIELVDPLEEEACFESAFLNSIGIAVDPADQKWRPIQDGKVFCKDADKAIIKRLKDAGQTFGDTSLRINHSYPFCERTDTPLIYRAVEAWYVRVKDLSKKLEDNNKLITWVPEAVGSNRFGNWLKDARDWNISRNRFWGSCLPIWVNVADATDTLCVGSVAELEQLSGQTITDLHKHHLDKVLIEKDGKTYQRTPEVLDCWFESGAMPYAQVHWMGGADGTQAPPVFPAQFIAEGLDQTRGWFYTLLVLSTALFDKPAFQNVVVNGLVLAEDGQKMSKSKKNYPDPHLVLDTYGADALRAYLIDSPVVRAEPLKFSEAGLKEIVRTVVLPYWNALSFFTTYASVDHFLPNDPAWQGSKIPHRAPLDRWVIAALRDLQERVNQEMEEYRLFAVVPLLVRFIDDLTNWYIRLSRRRFWKNANRQDQANAYQTLYEVLVTFTKILAPFMPFVTEHAYQVLVVDVDASNTAPKSVHWCDYPNHQTPQGTPFISDGAGMAELSLMRFTQRAVALGRKLREEHKLKIRQPLPSLTVIHRNPNLFTHQDAMLFDIIKGELNVKVVNTDTDEAKFCSISVKPNFAELRKRCGPKLKEIGVILASWSHTEVARLEAGEKIACCGEEISHPDVILQRMARPGLVVTTDGELTVALDTALTPDLTREGLAREFVSVLQQARKDAGLEVSDRIRVVFASDDAEVSAAMTTHSAFVADEVLAVELRADVSAATAADLNGRAVRYSLMKA